VPDKCALRRRIDLIGIAPESHPAARVSCCF
jgi:hypothetical protein